jgi:phosphoribosylformylglycinamidine synthase subunit PurL
VAIAEAAIGGPYAENGLGARLDLSGLAPDVPLDGLLYGEDGARAVVSVAPEHVASVVALAGEHGVPVHRAGHVAEPGGELELTAGGRVFHWSVGALRLRYFTAIPRRMQHPDVDRSAGE